jgi:hypothetical protein
LIKVVNQMPNKNNPDGPLHKWGEPEGVEYYKDKTPGQRKMKSFKETQKESKDEKIYTSLDHKINGKDYDTRMRDSWKNIHKIAGDLQRAKEKKAREAEARHNSEETDMSENKNKSARERLSDVLSGRKPGAMKPKKGKGSYDRKNKKLDELDQSTLKSYAAKASTDAKDERDYADYNKKDAPKYTGVLRRVRQTSAKNATKRAEKREAGVALAKKKMGESTAAYADSVKKIADKKKNDAISSSDKDKLSKLAAMMKREEIEQVDELKTSTLQKYVAKASKKHQKARDSYSNAAGRRSDFANDTPAMKKNSEIARKRDAGVERGLRALKKKGAKPSGPVFGHPGAHTEEVEQVDEGKIDKSSPMYKEYQELKKMPIKQLRNKVALVNRGDDVKGYDKEGAVSEILRAKYGKKKVDKVFGFSEGVQVDENRLLKVNTLSSAEYQRAKKLKGFDRSKYTWDSKQQLYIKEEVEQVDELKSSTVKSYVTKATKDRNVNNAHGMSHADSSQTFHNFGDGKKSDSELKKANKRFAKADKRQSGLDRAKKRYNEDVEQVDEALRNRIALKGKVERELGKVKTSSAEMAAFLLNQSADNDTKDIKKFLKSRKADKEVLKVFKKHMPELVESVTIDMIDRVLGRQVEEAKLTPAQDKHLDVHDDGVIDGKDFKKLRNMRKKK